MEKNKFYSRGNASLVLSNPRRPAFKAVSALTLLFFAFTTIVPRNGSAAAVVAEAAGRDVAAHDVSIPEKIGSVQERHEATGGGRFIFFIQDAHSVLDAQNNIQNIIDHLQKEYGIKTVAIEGGKGRLDPLLFRTFPEETAKKKVLGQYLDRGELSGDEMAAIFSKWEAEYHGIEDWDLYEKNYLSYLRVSAGQDAVLGKLETIRSEFDARREELYSDELNEFHKHVTSFQQEGKRLLELLQYLKTVREPLGISMEAYPHVNTIFKSIDDDASMDRDQIESSLQSLAEEFHRKHKTSLPKERTMEFMGHYQAFVTSREDAAAFLKFLIAFSESLNDPVEVTAGMRSLLGHADTLAAIRGTKLFDELNVLLEAVEAKLIRNDEEKALAEKFKKIDILKNLVLLEMSRDELREFQENSADLLGLYPDPADFDAAVEYYRHAVERDQALHRNLARVLDKSDARSAIVLAGGFHTQGFAESLKEKGYSYAVITPAIHSLKGQELYATVMSGKLSYADDLKTTFYDAFVRHASARMASELNGPDFKRTLKVWRDEVIRTLAEQGRTAEAGKYTPYIDMLVKAYVDKFGEKGLTDRTKDELLKELEGELKKFRESRLGALKNLFESRLKDWIEGFRGLVDRDAVTREEIARLTLALEPATSNLRTLRAALAPELAGDDTAFFFELTRRGYDPVQFDRILAEKIAAAVPAGVPFEYATTDVIVDAVTDFLSQSVADMNLVDLKQIASDIAPGIEADLRDNEQARQALNVLVPSDLKTSPQVSPALIQSLVSKAKAATGLQDDKAATAAAYLAFRQIQQQQTDAAGFNEELVLAASLGTAKKTLVGTADNPLTRVVPAGSTPKTIRTEAQFREALLRLKVIPRLNAPIPDDIAGARIYVVVQVATDYELSGDTKLPTGEQYKIRDTIGNILKNLQASDRYVATGGSDTPKPTATPTSPASTAGTSARPSRPGSSTPAAKSTSSSSASGPAVKPPTKPGGGAKATPASASPTAASGSAVPAGAGPSRPSTPVSTPAPSGRSLPMVDFMLLNYPAASTVSDLEGFLVREKVDKTKTPDRKIKFLIQPMENGTITYRGKTFQVSKNASFTFTGSVKDALALMAQVEKLAKTSGAAAPGTSTAPSSRTAPASSAAGRTAPGTTPAPAAPSLASRAGTMIANFFNRSIDLSPLMPVGVVFAALAPAAIFFVIGYAALFSATTLAVGVAALVIPAVAFLIFWAGSQEAEGRAAGAGAPVEPAGVFRILSASFIALLGISALGVGTLAGLSGFLSLPGFTTGALLAGGILAVSVLGALYGDSVMNWILYGQFTPSIVPGEAASLKAEARDYWNAISSAVTSKLTWKTVGVAALSVVIVPAVALVASAVFSFTALTTGIVTGVTALLGAAFTFAWRAAREHEQAETLRPASWFRLFVLSTLGLALMAGALGALLFVAVPAIFTASGLLPFLTALGTTIAAVIPAMIFLIGYSGALTERWLYGSAAARAAAAAAAALPGTTPAPSGASLGAPAFNIDGSSIVDEISPDLDALPSAQSLETERPDTDILPFIQAPQLEGITAITGFDNADRLAAEVARVYQSQPTVQAVRNFLVDRATANFERLRGETAANEVEFLRQITEGAGIFDALFGNAQGLENELSQLFAPLGIAGPDVAAIAGALRTAAIGTTPAPALASGTQDLFSNLSAADYGAFDELMGLGRQELMTRVGQAGKDDKFGLGLEHPGASLAGVLDSLSQYQQILKFLVILHSKDQKLNRSDLSEINVPNLPVLLDRTNADKAVRQAIAKLKSGTDPVLFVWSEGASVDQELQRLMLSVLTQVNQLPDRLKKPAMDAVFLLLFELALLDAEERSQILGDKARFDTFLGDIGLDYLAKGFQVGSENGINLSIEGFIGVIADAQKALAAIRQAA